MLKKKFICLGLSMIMLFTSIINTPAAVTAGQYYKIKYTHNKKTVTKRAIDARYNNKVIKTNIPGYIEGSISMYSALDAVHQSALNILIHQKQRRSLLRVVHKN